MDEQRSVAQRPPRVEEEEFVRTLLVGTLRGVDNERLIRVASSDPFRRLRFEVARVGPSVVSHHAHWKIRRQHLLGQRVVVAHRGGAAEQIAYRAPENRSAARRAAKTSDGSGVRVMDIFRPLAGVLVRPISQPWEQAKLQMIVGINEPGKK